MHRPVSWVADPPSAFQGLDSLGSATPSVTLVGKGSLRLDFGVEHAAWFEFQSPDLAATAAPLPSAVRER